MIDTIETTYVPGNNAKNEDAYVVEEQRNIFAVVDGATGLGGLPGDLAANVVKHTIESNLDLHLRSLILQANNELHVQVENKGGDALSSIPKYQRSTCGLAAVQLHGNNRLEFVAAGDCMAFIEYNNGEIRALNHDHIDKFDQIAIQEFHKEVSLQLKKLGAKPYELNTAKIKEILTHSRDAILPLLQENRNRLNTKNGYGVIDGSEEIEKWLEFGQIPLIGVKSILLLSDGLKLHSNNDKLLGMQLWMETARVAFAHGLNELKEQVLDLEINDPLCYRYPRLKPQDDKTGILVKFSS